MLAILVNVAYEEEMVYIYLLFILKIQQKSACSKIACCHSIDKKIIIPGKNQIYICILKLSSLSKSIFII